MIKDLAKESTLISDSDGDANGIMEQPVIVEDYEGSGGLSIMGYDGHSVFMPYRLVKDVTKVMLNYVKPKKKK